MKLHTVKSGETFADSLPTPNENPFVPHDAYSAALHADECIGVLHRMGVLDNEARLKCRQAALRKFNLACVDCWSCSTEAE